MAKQILIVDDSLTNLKMAQLILEKQKYEVRTATSGFDCITKLTEAPADLILLDIKMPMIDGFQTLRNIRGHKEWDNIPVIFLTAFSEMDQIKEAVGLGARDYIKKPFVPDDLVTRVSRVVGPALDEDELFEYHMKMQEAAFDAALAKQAAEIDEALGIKEE